MAAVAAALALLSCGGGNDGRAERQPAEISRPADAGTPSPGPPFYDGDEPVEFTHQVDSDGDGVCEGRATLRDGVYPNGTYPSCLTLDGAQQIGHGHWEYTELQSEARTGETEEKDYLDEQNGDTLGQFLRFLLNEPVRVDRAIRPSANPTGRYWQVDQWIGPGPSDSKLPLLTWTERFFECSGIVPCATIEGRAALGGYWSDHAAQLGLVPECGDGLRYAPDPPRNAMCGLAVTQ